jgi:hypothetical protein
MSHSAIGGRLIAALSAAVLLIACLGCGGWGIVQHFERWKFTQTIGSGNHNDRIATRPSGGRVLTKPHGNWRYAAVLVDD